MLIVDFSQVVGPITLKQSAPVFSAALSLMVKEDGQQDKYLFTDWDSSAFDQNEISTKFIDRIEYQIGKSST